MLKKSFMLMAVSMLAAEAQGGGGAPGSLDASFDGDGRVNTNALGAEDFASDIARQSDGKLVVVGFGRPGATFTDWAILRYNPDGSLDPSFSGDGKASVNLGVNDEAHAVAIQPDGRIVVAGLARGSTAGNSRRFAVCRFTSEGELDSTFSDDGILVVPGLPVAYSVALQPDGKIVLGGGFYFVSGSNFFVARLTVDGQFDPEFGGGDGYVYTPFPGNGEDVVYDIEVLEDGRILAAGQADPDSATDFGLARYLPNGDLDPSFDGDGLLTIKFGPDLDDVAYGVAIDQKDRIVVAGSGQPQVNYWNFALARLLPDGQLDTSFSGDGKVLTHFPGTPGSAWAFDVEIQANGKIVAAGRSNTNTQYDFALARYLEDGSLDPEFSGDGLVVTGFLGLEHANGLVIEPDGRIVAAGPTDSGSNLGDFAVGAYIGDPVPPPPIAGDVDGDGAVNINDLLTVINTWGACPHPCPADLNQDQAVNVDDLLMVVNNWS